MRRTGALALLGLGLIAATRAQEPRDTVGQERAFLELAVGPETIWVHQELAVVLRIGFDREFFARDVLQPFRRRLDLPLSVRAEWNEALAGARDLSSGSSGAGDGRRTSFVLDGQVAEGRVAADVVRGGRTFGVLEVERRLRPERAGFLSIPAPLASFTYGVEFRPDLLEGRVATSWRETFVHGSPLLLAVEPLPSAGRPEGFGGAVGRFRVRADARPRSLAVGESVELLLVIEGEGNLDELEPPDLAGLEGFHLYGLLDDAGPERRTLAYDLAPLDASVREIPAIPFAYFDPRPPAAYYRLATEPIALDVRPGTGLVAAGAAAPRDDGLVDLLPWPPAGARERPEPLRLSSLAWSLALPWLLALALRRWLAARERDRRDPARARARRAARAFERRVRRGAHELEPAFAEYLGARLERSRAAVVDARLASWLVVRGIERSLAERAAAALEALVHARYGAPREVPRPDEVRALVGELEAVFAREERA